MSRTMFWGRRRKLDEKKIIQANDCSRASLRAAVMQVTSFRGNYGRTLRRQIELIAHVEHSSNGVPHISDRRLREVT